MAENRLGTGGTFPPRNQWSYGPLLITGFLGYLLVRTERSEKRSDWGYLKCRTITLELHVGFDQRSAYLILGGGGFKDLLELSSEE